MFCLFLLPKTTSGTAVICTGSSDRIGCQFSYQFFSEKLKAKYLPTIMSPTNDLFTYLFYEVVATQRSSEELLAAAPSVDILPRTFSNLKKGLEIDPQIWSVFSKKLVPRKASRT